MKVLGISFGRRNQRSDVMVKEALFAAKAAGAEVQFINTVAWISATAVPAITAAVCVTRARQRFTAV